MAVSETHYYRTLNRWHRLHPIFRDTPTFDDALAIAIEGIDDPTGAIYYPNIGARFRLYEPWIDHQHVFAVRFEDLVSERRDEHIRRMMEFYVQNSSPGDVEELTRAAIGNVNAEKSHTFRKGKSGGWREAFTGRHHEAFQRVAGDILMRRGYES